MLAPVKGTVPGFKAGDILLVFPAEADCYVLMNMKCYKFSFRVLFIQVRMTSFSSQQVYLALLQWDMYTPKMVTTGRMKLGPNKNSL